MKIFESFEDFVNNGYNKIDEGKIVLKRQYGENSAVTTIKETKVRNKVLAAIKDGKISHEDFKAIVNEFSADSKKWLNRNARYFSVSEDGVSLSSYGSKVLSHINESEELNEINEGASIFSDSIDKEITLRTEIELIDGRKAKVLAIPDKSNPKYKKGIIVVSAERGGNQEIDINKDIKNVIDLNEDVDYTAILEGLKSSILSNLTNMQLAPKDLLKFVYGYAKVQLDQITDADLMEMRPMEAYKRKAGKELVFYVCKNETQNPYADSGAWRHDKVVPPNTLIAVANGQNEFMGTTWTGSYRSKADDRKQTMSTNGSDIGVNKSYKGYGASGLYNVKRIAEVADTAYVLNIDALNARFSTNTIANARAEAKRGAVALVDPKRFKEENLARYKTILANRASSDTDALDKMVEKAINDSTNLLNQALKSKKIGRYGDIIAGEDPKGREVKLSDVTDFMKRVLDDYGRFVQYTEQAKEDARNNHSGSYYEREAKNYALSTKQRIQKLDKLDIAW